MNVTKDVILDLLPLYVAGEASAATSALVEEFLKDDPVLAARARALRAEMGETPASGEPRPEIEMQSLRQTRRVLAWQRWLLAAGIALTAVGLSLRIESDGSRVAHVSLLLFEFPYALGAVLVAGIACLVAYRELRRRHRTGA